MYDIDKLNMEIMNIPCKKTLSHFATVAEAKAYGQGHRDARHAAVDAVLEHFKEDAEPSGAADERPLFEAWAEDRWEPQEITMRHNDAYLPVSLNAAWKAWQARAALASQTERMQSPAVSQKDGAAVDDALSYNASLVRKDIKAAVDLASPAAATASANDERAEFDKLFPPATTDMHCDEYDALADLRTHQRSAWNAAIKFAALANSGASHAANAGEDTARLDWLEESGHAYRTHSGHWVFSDMPFGKDKVALRDAIDAAIASSAEQEAK
jgi:hypothetical protein